MIKRLRDIITERYPNDYEQKTRVGRSFVALHRAGIADKLDDKGKAEGQFKADGVKIAPHNRAPQDGFPAEGENDEYNLPTYYNKRDASSNDEEDPVELEPNDEAGEEDEEDEDYEYNQYDDNDVDNYRARAAQFEETELDERTFPTQGKIKFPKSGNTLKWSTGKDNWVNWSSKSPNSMTSQSGNDPANDFFKKWGKHIRKEETELDEAATRANPHKPGSSKHHEWNIKAGRNRAKSASQEERKEETEPRLTFLQLMGKWDTINEAKKKKDPDWEPIDPKDERIGDEGHKPRKRKVKEETEQLMAEWNERKEFKKAEKGLERGRFRKKSKSYKGTEGQDRESYSDTQDRESYKVKEETEQLDEQSLTRKHFREVANTVRAIEDPKERQKFAEHHAGIFAKANPRFSFQKFHDACGTKSQLNDAPRKA